MSTKTIVITNYSDFSITINGQKLTTNLTTKNGVVSQLTNRQVRELGHEPSSVKGSRYILHEGQCLRQIKGGYDMAPLNLPRMFSAKEWDEVITSYLTPVPPPPPKKQKPRAYIPRQKPRRPRTGPPAKRGPAIKFVPLFAACKALAEAWPTAANLDDLAAIRDSIADGLAIAKRVAGED